MNHNGLVLYLEHPSEVPEALWTDSAPTQRISSRRVEASRYEHKIRIELSSDRQQHSLKGMNILSVTRSCRQTLLVAAKEKPKLIDEQQLIALC